MSEPSRTATTPEVPACAAIQAWGGIVVAGKRHHDCIRQLAEFEDEGIDRDRSLEQQGFMTTRGRFVDRVEAQKLFIAAGLVSADPGGLRGDILFSEDLY